MEKERIIKKLCELMPDNDIVSAIWYGNKGGKDVDIFLLIKGDTVFRHIESGFLDITMVGDKNFFSFVYLFDPIATEPILSGDVLFGQGMEYTREYLLSLYSNTQTVSHLKNFSAQIFNNALIYYKEKNYHKTLTNIVFALSYDSFADCYKTPTKVICFKKLLSVTKNQQLKDAYEHYKSDNLKPKKIKNFLETLSKNNK